MEKIIRENASEHKKKKPGISAHRPSKNRAQVAEAEQEVMSLLRIITCCFTFVATTMICWF